MLKSGFRPGDFLAAVIVAIGLTILLFLIEAHLVAAFGYVVSHDPRDVAPTGDPQADFERLRPAEDIGQMAKHSLIFVGSALVSLVGLGFALACIPSLRSLIHRIGLIRPSNWKASAKPPNRALRIYLKMLAVSAILATVLYVLMLIGLCLTND